MALTRSTGTLGWLVATDNSYSINATYSSNIATQMDQTVNYTTFLTERSGAPFPPSPVSSWLIPNTKSTNVAFNTFNDSAAVATGMPQQMINATNPSTDNAYWGVYFGAIPGQGQNGPAFGKIQVYSTTVTSLAGDGNNPNNVTSLAGLQALFLKIGQKYASFGGWVPGGDVQTSIDSAQEAGIMISLNGCIVYSA
jgi:hypothetical protein